jgi:hypothetical protein
MSGTGRKVYRKNVVGEIQDQRMNETQHICSQQQVLLSLVWIY